MSVPVHLGGKGLFPAIEAEALSPECAGLSAKSVLRMRICSAPLKLGAEWLDRARWGERPGMTYDLGRERMRETTSFHRGITGQTGSEICGIEGIARAGRVLRNGRCGLHCCEPTGLTNHGGTGAVFHNNLRHFVGRYTTCGGEGIGIAPQRGFVIKTRKAILVISSTAPSAARSVLSSAQRRRRILGIKCDNGPRGASLHEPG